MPNDKQDALAFLIDADNMSPAAVDEAFGHFGKMDVQVSVRRAYGGHEKLSGMKEVLRRHAIRAFVNHGKGTTDVALAVDAMDLLHRALLPGRVAIGSSDADFSPLAVRLREAGVRVLCFAQRSKADDEALQFAYDKVIYVDAQVIEKSPPAVPSPLQVERLPLAVPVTAAMPAAPAATADEGDAVRRILAVLPEWLPNTIKQLNQLGAPLRDGGIKKNNKPLHELFRRHPAYFKVLPVAGPAKQVRLLKKP
jgi:hypothetical protein